MHTHRCLTNASWRSLLRGQDSWAGPPPYLGMLSCFRLAWPPGLESIATYGRDGEGLLFFAFAESGSGSRCSAFAAFTDQKPWRTSDLLPLHMGENGNMERPDRPICCPRLLAAACCMLHVACCNGVRERRGSIGLTRLIYLMLDSGLWSE